MAAIACLPAAMSVAAEAGDQNDGSAVPAIIGPGEVLNLGTGLVVIILSIIVIGWLYSRTQGVYRAGGQVINILATQPLGPKEKVLLVEVANKQLVLGITATQIQTLHVMEEPFAGDKQIQPPTGFAARLRLAIKGGRR